MTIANPFKIIHRYKNNNKKIQYHVYIFIGNVTDQVFNILNEFKDKTLYQTLLNISINDHKLLSETYSPQWFKYFFVYKHIIKTIDELEVTSYLLDPLIKKFGKDWISKYLDIDLYITNKDIVYNFESKVNMTEILKKKKKKIKENLKKYKLMEQAGGNEDSEENEEINDDDDNDDNDNNDNNNEDEETEDEDIDPNENLFNIDNIETDTKEIKKLIKDTVSDKTTFKGIKFDESNDNEIHHVDIMDVHVKYYIRNQYIYEDDSILKIKNKICCNIMNKKFHNNPEYIIPSRQYLWIQYPFNDYDEEIMLGYKWLNKNKLLDIDYIPNENIAVYEELRYEFKVLKEILVKFSNKIRPIDNHHDILSTYKPYYNANEIFMTDLYNDLGVNYSPSNDKKKNIIDIYLKLYYPTIKETELNDIIKYLNSNESNEANFITDVFDTIYNENIMELEIDKYVNETIIDNKYQKYFLNNYITHSVVHVDLSHNNSFINLYKIFNNFKVDEKYPFVIYITKTGNIVYKFNTNEVKKLVNNNDDLFNKWFNTSVQNTSVHFKIMKNGKAINAYITELGKIEYRNHWKETDNVVYSDIEKTHSIVYDLLNKINLDNTTFQIVKPEKHHFVPAYQNSIQKINVPKDIYLNHNELSDFARYFYPYVAIVIDPKKRQSKVASDVGKSGTYLRYKKISNYENKDYLQHKILNIMRNYEYNDIDLAHIIGNQFNITDKDAIIQINEVRKKYPNINQIKSRRILKKLDKLPKSKSPGIVVDIQGKQHDKYKIRISGSHNIIQLNKISTFVNVLVYLYIETYIIKKKTRQDIKEKLKDLTNIAKRRNIVNDIIEQEQSINSKNIVKMDKDRLGFKTDKGVNQWTRACQNSGKTHRRRPNQYNTKSLDKLIKDGYKMNKKTGFYEKKVIVNKKEITLKTIKLSNTEDTEDEIYYTCDPVTNGEHFYVGFLTKSNNPLGFCMPCCFKKDQLSTTNKKKQKFINDCLNNVKQEQTITSDNTYNQLYILQDTNKIQEGRYGMLPTYLDMYLNANFNKTAKFDNHYLSHAPNGYFLKYGMDINSAEFTDCIQYIYNISFNDIKNKIVSILNNDKQNNIFTYIDAGNIRGYWQSRDRYIDFIKSTNNIDISHIYDILSIPGVLSNNGTNIFIFERIVDKKLKVNDISFICSDINNMVNIIDDKRDNIFILKDDKFFYPILLLTKSNEQSKNIDTNLIFKYNETSDNIINYVSDLYIKSCMSNSIDDIISNDNFISSNTLFKVLSSLNKPFQPKTQIINNYFKCTYIVTNNSLILPVKLSGSILNLPISYLNDVDKYLLSYTDTISLLNELVSLTKLKVKPIGFYYDSKTNNDIHAIGIMTSLFYFVPIIKTNIPLSYISKNNYIIDHRYDYSIINNELLNNKIYNGIGSFPINYYDNIVFDDRIISVNYTKYKRELYQLFRLEFSDFVTISSNNHQKLNEILRTVISESFNSLIKIYIIRCVLFKLIHEELFNTYIKFLKPAYGNEIFDFINNYLKKTNFNVHSFINLSETIPDLSKENYAISNDRNLCKYHNSKKTCSSVNCSWMKQCKLSVPFDLIVKFIYLLSNEMIFDDIKYKELFKLDDYYVSDVININNFNEEIGMPIIKQGIGFVSAIENIFSNKYKSKKIIEKNDDVPMNNYQNFYIQSIMPENISLYRAFANSFYWVKNKLINNDIRNLGYFDNIQTEIALYFRGSVVDWLIDSNNITQINDNISQYFNSVSIEDYVINLVNNISINTNSIIDLYILNQIIDIPIIVVDYQFIVIHVFDKKIVNKDKLEKYEKLNKDYIYLQFINVTNDIPNVINSMYIK